MLGIAWVSGYISSVVTCWLFLHTFRACLAYVWLVCLILLKHLRQILVQSAKTTCLFLFAFLFLILFMGLRTGSGFGAGFGHCDGLGDGFGGKGMQNRWGWREFVGFSIVGIGGRRLRPV